MSVVNSEAAVASSGGVKAAPRKNWHAPRKAFRPGRSLTSYEQRKAAQKAMSINKAVEAEMKAEKARVKEEQVAKIRERREKKAEKERWEKMEQKMHQKRVERLKRREKRNKMLNS